MLVEVVFTRVGGIFWEALTSLKMLRKRNKFEEDASEDLSDPVAFSVPPIKGFLREDRFSSRRSHRPELGGTLKT